MASSALRRRISTSRISAAFGNSYGSRNRRMSSSNTSRDESCPWLMLPPHGGGGGGSVYKYYSLVEKRVVSTQTKWSECGEWEFVGSSHGWLALFNQPTNRLFLSSPISGRLVKLPPVPERSVDIGRRPPIVSKVILSPSPSPSVEGAEECRAVMTFGPGNSMAFYSPFASSGIPFPQWDPFGDLFFDDPLFHPDHLLARVYEDLVYCRRRRVLTCITPIELDLESYAYRGCDYICEVDNWDIHHPQLCKWKWKFTPTPEVARLSTFMGGGENTRRWALEQQHCIQIPHLVYAEELDQLYLVMRLVALVGPDGRHLRQVPHCPIRGLKARYPCQTVGFVVLKVFQACIRLGSYEVVDGLDGLAMFVGVNHSFALPASRFPELKPDSIYFTDAKRLSMLDGVGDTGVFDYANKTISPIVIPDDDDDDDPPSPSSSPIWFYPPTA